jgi:exodeoxyribonuclease VII large subunit
VAQAIAQSHNPVICGVGHETDTTIADFVADLRAPTPSAAAAAAVPDGAEIAAQLALIGRRLAEEADEQLDLARAHVRQSALRLQRLDPRRQIDLHRQRLEDRLARVEIALRRKLDRLAAQQTGAEQQLVALNPQAVLRRGYSIVQTLAGAVVTQPTQAAPGEALLVRAAGGAYAVRREA